MVSPAQLVECVSAVTGVPLPTVVDIDRRLAKASLRTIGGRGFSAARMTSLDAARLLTAILANPQANASAEAVERYALTRVDKTRSSETLFAATDFRELADLPARHGFVDALEALIATASTGSMARQISDSRDGWLPRIEVFAFTRATRGRMRIAGLPSEQIVSVEYQPAGAGKKSAQADNRDRSGLLAGGTGDLEQSRRITERTILAIGQLLAEEN